MKKIILNFLKRNKRLIKLFIVLFVLGVTFLVLYFTDNIQDLQNKAIKEYNKITIVSIVLYILFFFFEIFKGWFTNLISDWLFPGGIQEINETTKK